MKKTTVIAFLLLAMPLMACTTVADRFGDNISELRTDVYVHREEHMGIDIFSGFRERNFTPDGSTNSRVDFIIITIVPSVIQDGMEYDFVLKFAEQSHSGRMIRHPFNESFSVEIEGRTRSNSLSLSLTPMGGQTQTFELNNAFRDNMINYQRALEIAHKRLYKHIVNLTRNGILHAELFVRFVQNPLDNQGNFYWYIAIYDIEGNTFAVLVDPVSEAILAVRENNA